MSLRSGNRVFRTGWLALESHWGVMYEVPIGLIRVARSIRMGMGKRTGMGISLGILIGVMMVVAEVDSAPDAYAQVVDSIRVEEDLVYHRDPSTGQSLHLDLIEPNQTRYPSVILVPGRDWTQTDRKEVAHIGQALAVQGLGVAIVDYSLPGPPLPASEAMHPRQVQDLALALRFIRGQRLLAGQIPDDIFLLGIDAGAHLASLLASNPRFLDDLGLDASDVRGFVGISGIYRIEPSGRDHTLIFGLDPALRMDASPHHQLSFDTPPGLLIEAEFEKAGRHQASADFVSRMQEFGRPVHRERLPNVGYSELPPLIGREKDPITPIIMDFVASFATRLEPSPTPIPLPSPTPTPTPKAVHPPLGPSVGPGSEMGLLESEAIWSQHETGAYAYWLVQPDPNDMERGNEAKQIMVFLPAAQPVDPSYPQAYRAWVEHIAKRGNVVIIPRYTGPGIEAESWPAFARRALRVAVLDLQTKDPKAERYDMETMGLIGHGEGAILAMGIAGRWYEDQLPLPNSLMIAMPRDPIDLLASDLRWRIPQDLKFVYVTGDADPQLDPQLEGRIWHRINHLSVEWRSRIELKSDYYGRPALVAGYQTPYAEGFHGQIDTLDRFGLWKWHDGLMDCTRRGTHCEFVFGGRAPLIDMGKWSDLHPVKRASWGHGPEREPIFRQYLPFARKKGPGSDR